MLLSLPLQARQRAGSSADLLGNCNSRADCVSAHPPPFVSPLTATSRRAGGRAQSDLLCNAVPPSGCNGRVTWAEESEREGDRPVGLNVGDAAGAAATAMQTTASERPCPSISSPPAFLMSFMPRRPDLVADSATVARRGSTRVDDIVRRSSARSSYNHLRDSIESKYNRLQDSLQNLTAASRPTCKAAGESTCPCEMRRLSHCQFILARID